MVSRISYQDNFYLIYTTCKPYNVRGQRVLCCPRFFYSLVSCAPPGLLLEPYASVDYYHVRQLFILISNRNNHTMLYIILYLQYRVHCD